LKPCSTAATKNNATRPRPIPIHRRILGIRVRRRG
jgi:hypothetical protein